MVISRSPSWDAMITIPGCIDRHPGMHRSPSRDASIAIPGCIDRHPGMHRSPSRDASIAISRSPSRDAMVTILGSMIAIPGCIDRHPRMHQSQSWDASRDAATPSSRVSITTHGCMDRMHRSPSLVPALPYYAATKSWAWDWERGYRSPSRMTRSPSRDAAIVIPDA